MRLLARREEERLDAKYRIARAGVLSWRRPTALLGNPMVTVTVLAAMVWLGALRILSPVIGLLGLVGLMGSAVAYLVRRREADELTARLARIQLHIADNELGSAAKLIDEVCARARSFPEHHLVAVWRRAYVCGVTGELDLARRLYQEIIDSKWIPNGSTGKPSLALLQREVATCMALNGDLEHAESRLELVRLELSDRERAALVLVEAIVAARYGDVEHLPERIDGMWRRAEQRLEPAELRALRIVRAFAIERRCTPQYRTQGTVDVDAALEGARPFSPGEYDYLGAQWTDMRDFLERHGLAAA